MQTYAHMGTGAELLHVRNNCVTEVEIIHEKPRGGGLLSRDYGVPVNLIENPRCESRIRVSSHAWPKLSSLDDWQPGRKRYAPVQVYRIPPRIGTWRNIDFPFIAPPRETREIAPTVVRCPTFTPSFPWLNVCINRCVCVIAHVKFHVPKFSIQIFFFAISRASCNCARCKCKSFKILGKYRFDFFLWRESLFWQDRKVC